MESYILDLYPNRGPIYLGLFQNITNDSELRDRIEKKDETLGLCLIDASLVVNKFHALLAINRAVHDEQTTKIKTHNIHAEICFNFGINNNIAKTFKTFGLKPETTNVIAIRVGSSSTEQAESYIKKCVKGKLVDFNNLSSVRDLKAIEKVYLMDDQKGDEDKIMSLVAGSMALKGH